MTHSPIQQSTHDGRASPNYPPRTGIATIKTLHNKSGGERSLTSVSTLYLHSTVYILDGLQYVLCSTYRSTSTLYMRYLLYRTYNVVVVVVDVQRGHSCTAMKKTLLPAPLKYVLSDLCCQRHLYVLVTLALLLIAVRTRAPAHVSLH